MKNLFKTALAVVLVMGSTSLFAQKFGRVNLQEVVVSMPEFEEMQKNVEAYQTDLRNQLEAIGVEFNTKLQEYSKSAQDATLSDSVKQLKEKELQDLQSRYQQFEQMSQEELQKKYNELLAPIVKKAQEAVEKLAKEGGYTVVFDSAAGVYFDEAAVTNLFPALKSALNLKELPAGAAAAAAAPGAAATTAPAN